MASLSPSPAQSPLRTELSPSSSVQDATAVPAVQDSKSALADRMARFKALKMQHATAKSANLKAIHANEMALSKEDELQKVQKRHDEAAWKLARLEDPDGRKRAMDYTIEEDENWNKRVAKKERNKNNNVFRNYGSEAKKVYKRQVKQMGRVNLEAYQAQKAAKIEDQLNRGLLVIRQDDHGNNIIVDPVTGRENEPVEESHMIYEHKPDKEAQDRLVADAEKAERNRLEARRKNQQNSDNQGGDVTYINEKNKQFNLRLARAYNKHTAETRESFERGTAL